MNIHRFPCIILCCSIMASAASAQSPLPLVDGADSSKVRTNCEKLLSALDQLGAPMPRTQSARLRELLRSTGDQALLDVQRLLDEQCLIGVHVNPESRVKAARGPAEAVLTRDGWTVFLVKMHNEAGVTQPLKISGPHLIIKGGEPGDRWLEAEIYHEKPMPEKLTGHELEYLVARFRTKATGRREARLVFDVGQGTQDLGFRAEVPVLFTIPSK
jgi:hypothetical protein